MNVGESSLDSVVIVGESFVIDAEEVQDGGVVVVPMDGFVDGFPADFVGCSPVESGFESTAGHPDGESVHIMISTGSDDEFAGLSEGCASEFCGTENEGIVKQSAFFEVVEEGCDGLIKSKGFAGVIFVDVFVTIPIDAWGAEGAAGEELDEADALFEESASEEAASGEVGGFFAVDAVEAVSELGFLSEVGDAGDSELHFGGELIGLDTGLELVFTGGVLEGLLVHELEEFARVFLGFGCDIASGKEVADGRS